MALIEHQAGRRCTETELSEFLRLHDTNGIFRSDSEWHELLSTCCPPFQLRASGFLRHKRVWRDPCPGEVKQPQRRSDYWYWPCFHVHQGSLPVVGMIERNSTYQKFYVLERRAK